ncbi:hypothetical protein Tco_0151160 [Tanacetum coccineum]
MLTMGSAITLEEEEYEAQGRKKVKMIPSSLVQAAGASQKDKAIDREEGLSEGKRQRERRLSLAWIFKKKLVLLKESLIWKVIKVSTISEQISTDSINKSIPSPDKGQTKIEANAELSKSVLGSGLQGEDFAKKMVELVNQRKKHFAEERARAKRNKPMTQSQLRTYMMNYLKNQGTWKLSQLKNLSFEEVKEEFDKLVKQVESFTPINFEATKDSLKRFGEELQTKTSKRLKSDEAKDDESTKKTGKRRKQIARKGLHTDLDKDDSEDSDEASEKDDSTSGTKIPINPVPVAMKSPSIANYKIIKQGRKGVYQIVRENGTDKVYISFGAMLTDISRDDLTELYRIVMRKHGMNEPEDEFEKVLWGYLKNMFEEPLSTDSIWSLPGQQRLICWRYYEACRVHCLNLESMDIYMLIERKYPLSAEVCKAMLDKKLQGGKPDEDCYKMLKMMEKQAGIRKHKDWLVQEQTALGKDFSNPLMADNLPKIVWLSTHHIFDTLAGNPVKKILLKLNLSDHRSILTDSKEYLKMVMERQSVKVKEIQERCIIKAFQDYQIKKGMSMSVQKSQVHEMAKFTRWRNEIMLG